MSLALLMGLFLCKHGFLCHVVDFGYSLSRRRGEKAWGLGLCGHILAETVGSLYLLHPWSWEPAIYFLGIEIAALLFTGLMERRAPLRKLLSTHLSCELLVIGGYLSGTIYLLRWT